MKHETEIKQDMEGLVWNAVEILVENQNKTGYEKKQDMKNPEIWGKLRYRNKARYGNKPE